MADAGFFRGTSADQDNRFANKQKKLLKDLNASPILSTKLIKSKLDLDALKPWIESRIKEILEMEDEILSETIYEHLAGKEPDGKSLLMTVAGFSEECKASKFMEELWSKLVELQESSNGVEKAAVEESPGGDTVNTKGDRHDCDSKQPADHDNDKNVDSHHVERKDDRQKKYATEKDEESKSSSHSRSGSRSLDGQDDRPRKKIPDSSKDNGSREGSKTPTPTKRQSRSPTRPKSRSGSGSPRRRSPGSNGEVHRRSRSNSRSHSSRSKSRSRSKSTSRSRSISRSRTRSRSHSPRYRRRSPPGGYRGRRSHSRSPGRGFRPRSRSPMNRRGYTRGPYRGPYGGFQDRRRGMAAPYRGQRQSPWNRRRFSPRSPVRRRRSPSYSPRRQHSPSPPSYRRRRISRSRSPPGHMMNRPTHSPRPHPAHMGHMDAMPARAIPHRDFNRPMMRSPRAGFMDQRGYGDVQAMPPRHHSPPPMGMSKMTEMYPPTHSSAPVNPLDVASRSRIHSPSPSRKKHKKDKKHKKHKKHSSKKHSRDRSRSRSETPDKKRKRHKKHKKTKKHR